MLRYDDGTPIVPHLPIWAKEGNKVVGYSAHPFTDRMGNQAIVHTVSFLDKKGKEGTAVSRVIWLGEDDGKDN